MERLGKAGNPQGKSGVMVAVVRLGVVAAEAVTVKPAAVRMGVVTAEAVVVKPAAAAAEPAAEPAG